MKDELLRLIQIAKDTTGIAIGYEKDGELRIVRTRQFDKVMVKSCIMNILVRKYKIGVAKVGRLMGMDHTTVIHHRDGHPTRYEYEPEYKKIYDMIVRESGVDEELKIDVEEVLSLIREIA